MMNTYTAITIGPIGKTFDKARKVKALWSASYMFSWIMRELLRELTEKGYKVISPYYASVLEREYLLRQVGLFPDRAIIRGEVECLEEIKDKVIRAFAEKMLGINKEPKPSKAIKALEAYLKNYISIYSTTAKVKNEKGFILKLNARLDALELRQRAATKKDIRFRKLLASNNGFIQSYLDVQKRKGGSEKVPFETTSRIAVSGWLTDEEIEKYTIKSEDHPEGEKEVAMDYARLSTKKRDSYRNCYKYLAVVKADGDSFGKFLEKITEEQMKKFSRYFFDFSREAAKGLMRLKGIPVYIGGDDLFFFTPILRDGNQQVSELIQVVEKHFKKFRDKLAKKHKKLFKELAKGEAQPLTMSYGVSIFYYKSPMSEAIEVADNLLFKVAKGSGRDRVAVSIHKHSGRKIEFTLPCKYSTKGEEEQRLYREATELIKKYSADQDAMLDGLIHWFDEMFDVVITPILNSEKDEAKREQRLLALCENFFDEDIHKEEDKRDFLVKIFEFIALLADKHYPAKEIKQLIYGLLRYCQFITDKEER